MSERVHDVFTFYYNFVKILYCEIEARDNTLPVELLFEIHAAFDHLRRFYHDGEDEALSSRRAIGHLKRGALDAFKLKLKYFNEDVEALIGKGVCLRLVDNGTYLPSMISRRQHVVKLGKEARKFESKKEHNEAFDRWQETSTAIDRFYTDFLGKEILENIDKAGFEVQKWTWKDRGWGFFIGITTGVISSVAVWWFTRG